MVKEFLSKYGGHLLYDWELIIDCLSIHGEGVPV